MKSIKTDFQHKICAEIGNAIGVYGIFAAWGAPAYIAATAQYPTARLLVGVGHPDDLSKRKIKYAPEHQQVVKLIKDNPEITNEGFLSNIVQHWFAFLQDLYRDQILVTLRGGSTQIKSVAIKRISLAALSQNSLEQTVLDEAVEYFDRVHDSTEKLDLIVKILNRPLPAQIKQTIKISIAVRNVIQHSMGQVRKRDLSFIGAQSFGSDDGQRVTAIAAGSRIRVTLYDLENFCDALIAASNALVPS